MSTAGMWPCSCRFSRVFGLEQLLLRFWTFYCVNIPALWLDDAWEMLWDSYQLYKYFSSCSSPSVLLYTPCHVFLIHASHSLSLYNFPWSCSVFPHPCLFQKFGFGTIYKWFWKKSLLLTKTVFIWSKIQLNCNIVKNYYSLKELFYVNSF